MTTMSVTHPKIGEEHLARKAIVYVRQSSQRQVVQNTESQRLQYALKDRARDLGWNDVEVIDTDLGTSAGIGSATRVGFDRLVGAVALGEVGIILSREVSRLSRTDKDWCHLLEVCQIFDTLIGDEEQIYDLSLIDDQLVLGIKGTLSVVELKVLKMRMLRGMEEKAARGELEKLLPPGFVRDATGRVVKDPDRRVREAMALVFQKLHETGTVRQAFKWFHDNEVQLPVNKSQNGRMGIVWQLPTHSFIGAVLRNPFYAGAYAYGQRTTVTKVVDKRVVKRVSRFLKPEDCRVFIKDHHEGYIVWDAFEENQRMIRSNSIRTDGDESVTSVRAGQGLLVGLLRCGRCGRQIHVHYWGRKGTSGRYLCKGDYASGGSYCLAFGGRGVDRRLSEELLKVISPLGLEASLEAIDNLGSSEDARQQLLSRQQEQLEWEAQRAFEQYNEVDPRNRLVAAELERRWNSKLEEVDRITMTIAALARDRQPLTDELRKRILAMGECFAEVWHDDGCPVELKKRILRTAITEIVANEDEETEVLHFVIHWAGGVHTEIEIPKPKSGSGHRTSMEVLGIIRNMAVRYGDDQIAGTLNRLGYRTGKGKRFNQTRVKTARRNHKIEGQRRAVNDPRILNQEQAATLCGISTATIRRMVAEGLLPKEQIVPYAPWEICRADLDSEPVQAVVNHLKNTGKLVLRPGHLAGQKSLF
jgi:DNA invertase Pin-like site-specific DNA recombinase